MRFEVSLTEDATAISRRFMPTLRSMTRRERPKLPRRI